MMFYVRGYVCNFFCMNLHLPAPVAKVIMDAAEGK